MMAEGTKFRLGLLTAILSAYLISAVDQFAFEAYGVKALYGQIFCLSIFIATICYCIIGRLQRTDNVARSRFTSISLILFLIVVWHFIEYLRSSQSDVVLNIFIARIKCIAFLLIMGSAIYLTESMSKIRIACIGLVALGALLAVFDFINPSYSTVPGRGAGFYLNPNEAAMMLCLLATIASSGQSIRVNMAVWGVAAIGIAVTFSRAGWLILVIALIGLGALGQFGRGRSRAIFVGLVFLLIAFLYYATASGELADFVKGTGLAPYLDANTVARLGASGSLIDDSSTLDRSDVLAAGWQAFLDSPILGNGLGYTFEWLQPESTHNMYVLMLAEQGVLGTLLYVSLLGALLAWSRGVFRVVAVLIAVAAFFTHDQLDQPYATAVMGVTLAALMSGGHANRQANRLWRVAGAALPAQ